MYGDGDGDYYACMTVEDIPVIPYENLKYGQIQIYRTYLVVTLSYLVLNYLVDIQSASRMMWKDSIVGVRL